MTPPGLLAATVAGLPVWAAEAAARTGGLNWGGLAVLVVLAAVAWPLWRRLRARLSRERHDRWAEDEGWGDRTAYTPEDDPDLRRHDGQGDDQGRDGPRA